VLFISQEQTCLDHRQVRRYESWYGHVTLSALALVFLAVTRAALADYGTGPVNSANEIRRMFSTFRRLSADELQADRRSL
jgi:hypothetical protein